MCFVLFCFFNFRFGDFFKNSKVMESNKFFFLPFFLVGFGDYGFTVCITV